MHQALRKTSRPVKNVLLDHTFVAGIGNIYACEICFAAALILNGGRSGSAW